jgi:hypothetical protein
MALSKFTISQIVEIVAADPDCQHRVNSWLGKIPTDTGTAGVVRNYAIGFMGMITGGSVEAFDPSEREAMAYQYSCDGIAEVTSKAINAKLDKVAHLAKCDQQAREKGYSHTGTMLVMDDETRYVLDWWKSLNIRDPFVFQYRNFMQDLGGGIPYSSFKGFS